MAPVLPPKADATPRPRVLVVNDEPGLVELIRDLVGREVNCRVDGASSLAQARQILSSTQVEVLVTDVHLPDGDGISLLPTLHQHQPHASAIVITGAPSLD